MNLPSSTPRTPLEFADVLWSDYPSGYLAVGVKSQDPNKNFRLLWGERRSLYGLARDAALLAKDNDVYFGVASYSDKSRNLEAVKNSNWLWADLDNHPLGSDVPNPTIVIETSSGRTQALWAIKGNHTPFEIEDRVAAIAFASSLGHDAVKANQILRVPSTTNHKQGRNNWTVYIGQYRPNALYRREDFAHLPSAPASPSEAKTVTLISPEDAYLLWHPAYDELRLRMKRVACCEPEAKPNGKEYKSASEGDMALITALVRAGYSPEEAGAMFLHFPRGKWCIERHGYIEARKRAATHAAGAKTFIALPSYISIPLSIFAAGLDPIALAVYVVGFVGEVIRNREHAGIKVVHVAAAVVQPSPMTGRKDVTTDGTQHRAFIVQAGQEYPADRHRTGP